MADTKSAAGSSDVSMCRAIGNRSGTRSTINNVNREALYGARFYAAVAASLPMEVVVENLVVETTRGESVVEVFEGIMAVLPVGLVVKELLLMVLLA